MSFTKESLMLPEKPFDGKVVYYSGSIHGAPEREPDFAWQLVQFMIENGADVPSEHVAARNPQEMHEVRMRHASPNFREAFMQPEIWYPTRAQDLEWVDGATHVVALLNAPSHGVCMELERALLKSRLGLNLTPVLGLVHPDRLPKLSMMIRGVTQQEAPEFYLKTYEDLDEAKHLVTDFLTGKITRT